MDITRLISRADEYAATGIDRVELAYAKYFAKLPTTVFVRLLPGLGVFPVNRKKAETLVEKLCEKWTANESIDPGEVVKLQTYIDAADTVQFPGIRRSEGNIVQRLSRFALNNLKFASLNLTRRLGGRNSVYIHVSHALLHLDRNFRWIHRTDTKALFFLHDIIPISHPQYCSDGAAEQHKQRVRIISRYADLVVVNSQATRDELISFLKSENKRVPDIIVAYLGVDHLPVHTVPELNVARPYFTYVSTIEARKNHMLLLRVWKRLIRKHGRSAPQLFLIGGRGWKSERTFEFLETESSLRGHVFEVGKIANNLMASLMNGARGALMPSFVEGFGLPLVEALQQNIDTIASDIPVHREVATGRAILLPTDDPEPWEAAIMSLTETKRKTRKRPDNELITHYSWKSHFEVINASLKRIMSD